MAFQETKEEKEMQKPKVIFITKQERITRLKKAIKKFQDKPNSKYIKYIYNLRLQLKELEIENV